MKTHQEIILKPPRLKETSRPNWAERLAFARHYLVLFEVGVAVLFLMPGCATTGEQTSGGTRDLITTGLTTAAGGYIGAKTGHGAKGAAIGAAAGFIAGETINYFNDKAQSEAYLAGYEKGQSNAVKQQYWIARDNQRARTDDGYEESLYEIPVPATDQDGVHREASTRVIRVVVPREGDAP
jgi:hypothetical protein